MLVRNIRIQHSRLFDKCIERCNRFEIISGIVNIKTRNVYEFICKVKQIIAVKEFGRPEYCALIIIRILCDYDIGVFFFYVIIIDGQHIKIRGKKNTVVTSPVFFGAIIGITTVRN